MGLQSFLDNLSAGAEQGLMSAIVSIIWPAVAMVIVSLTPSDYLWLTILGIVGLTILLTIYELQHLLSSLIGFLIGYGVVVVIGLQVAPKLFATAFLQLLTIAAIKVYDHYYGQSR